MTSLKRPKSGKKRRANPPVDGTKNAASAAFFVGEFVIRQVCQLPPVSEQVFVDTILEPTRSKVFSCGHRRKISNIEHALGVKNAE